MPFEDLVPFLDDEVEDADEETFLLYSNPMPSQNLGFIDPKATTLELSLAGRDLTIHQSPTVLASTRAGGTTGAVLWKVTPLFAEWLSSPSNPLVSSGLLTPSSAVLELGCGISPLNALALAPRVSQYVLSDQAYVSRLLARNLSANANEPPPAKTPTGPRMRNTAKHAKLAARDAKQQPSTVFRPLDWEADEVVPSLAAPASRFDAVIATDCVFNYALVEPFVQTCADACALGREKGETDAAGEGRSMPEPEPEPEPEARSRPCVCLVAQQLRNDDVFRSWLAAFMSRFRVWRVKGHLLPGLTPGDGFVVHVGVLRDG